MAYDYHVHIYFIFYTNGRLCHMLGAKFSNCKMPRLPLDDKLPSEMFNASVVLPRCLSAYSVWVLPPITDLTLDPKTEWNLNTYNPAANCVSSAMNLQSWCLQIVSALSLDIAVGSCDACYVSAMRFNHTCNQMWRSGIRLGVSHAALNFVVIQQELLSPCDKTASRIDVFKVFPHSTLQ